MSGPLTSALRQEAAKTMRPMTAAASGTAVSDSELILRVASANEPGLRQHAFRQLASRHGPRAFAIAMRVLHHRPDAEEAVQDALTRVWSHAARFDGDRSAFSTWFYRIVTNAALDQLRRRPPPAEDVAAFEDILPDDNENGELKWIRGAESQRVRAAVAALPSKQRVAVALCYFDDFTQPEAARIMDVNIKALEGLLFRAKASLKRSLAQT